MSLLHKWVNDLYLNPDYIEDLVETVKSKPEIKYLVLDNFFKTEVIDRFIEEHKKLNFSEQLDKYTSEGELLPYDSSVCFMSEENYGYELLFSREWFNYLSKLFSHKLSESSYTGVKLRYHEPNAKGFWIHTDHDSIDLTFICYFNKKWKVSDGGMLQLWRVEECNCQNTINVDAVYPFNTKMDYLNNVRLYVDAPGEGFSDRKGHDLVLVDQILPIYNRVFICNRRANPTYHSVTPSGNRERTGFVQWIYNK